jgi:ATP-dependent helicase HrpA
MATPRVAAPVNTPDDIEARLDRLRRALRQCARRERLRLRRRLDSAPARLRSGDGAERLLPDLEKAIAEAQALRAARAGDAPAIRYPEALPVVQRREEIAAAIEAHPVIILCGETGSGKTTQLPKICLELGRGVDGLIGHTQPRRIAARSVAARIAEELERELGGLVGYQVRFAERCDARTRIKLMTDGILLNEIRADRRLDAYDTLIIDEAHERSLNIDFLLGYLKRLSTQRPDLRLIITSATIDPERFARHFDEAPVIEVSGRGYPVTMRYRPLQGEAEEARDLSLLEGVTEAVSELAQEGPGDVLVFLPGEREIREAAEQLRKHHPPATEILPLYARLATHEQHRIFASHARRRIVLATNVAETSLTVPGIRYVVDSGLARISRYSWRAKLQRLPVEPVSQASADQRAGRCGRLGPGICIRLFDEEDYARRARYTDPEVLRTNLASVILQMAELGLGDPRSFPFIDAPDPRLIKDGYRLLHELGAVDAKHRLTATGRRLARLPVDPRLGRILREAAATGCLREALIIVSALAVQDPRERPQESRAAADTAHARFQDPRSDFIAWLNLWDYWRVQSARLGASALRRLCREEFLGFMRMREWRETHHQLRRLMLDEGARENEQEADYASLHRALASGLLSNLATRTSDGEFLGARNRKLRVFPGSGLARRPPKWLIAAEISETTRVYARTVAEIDPGWLEPLAAQLTRREVFEPHWQRRAGRAGAYERVTLFGLTLVARRRIDYTPIDPAAARELFIRHALVYGEFPREPAFLRHNLALVESLEDLEARARRRDLVVDEAVMQGFYEDVIPHEINTVAAFERWRRKAERDDPKRLFFRRERLMQHEAEEITAERYPDLIKVGSLRLPLRYRFEPGAQDDGVSVTVPLAALDGLPEAPFEWLVPGLIEERVTALIRALPKALRRHLVPAPDFASAVLQRLEYRAGDLYAALGRELAAMTGVEIAREAWDVAALPAHLRMRYVVIDAEGEERASGRDLEALRAELSGAARSQIAQDPGLGFERQGLTEWDFETLPDSVQVTQHGIEVELYPALVDAGECVDLRLLETPDAAAAATRAGLVRLLRLRASETERYLRRALPDTETLCLQFAAVAPCARLMDDIVEASCRRALGADIPRRREAWAQLADRARAELVPTATEIATTLGPILAAHHALRGRLRGTLPLSWIEAARDIDDQLRHLVYPGFVAATPQAWLGELPRYLRALERRLERLDRAPDKDRRARVELEPLWDRVRTALERDAGVQAADWRWAIEELRVSLFAQELGTRRTVSPKRVDRQLRENGL